MTAGTVVITGGILATVILLCIIAVLCYCRLQVSPLGLWPEAARPPANLFITGAENWRPTLGPRKPKAMERRRPKSRRLGAVGGQKGGVHTPSAPFSTQGVCWEILGHPVPL